MCLEQLSMCLEHMCLAVAIVISASQYGPSADFCECPLASILLDWTYRNDFMQKTLKRKKRGKSSFVVELSAA
jgi:hypothetical protein